MLFGHLDASDTYDHLLSHPIWDEAFRWLRESAATAELGIHKLQDDDLFVSVQQYETLPRTECRFESHKEYLDLQYCIQGGEMIEWMLASDLKLDGEYDPTNDFQFYLPAESKTAVQMLPRNFVILHPSDAHMPKVTDGVHRSVNKLVIKIRSRLLK